ncbi:flavodoxin [bacterium]|nr:flavodoxin [bacterium]
MNIAVRYYTKTGNSKKLAEAVGNELSIEALSIENDLIEEVDILFLANSVYYAGIDKNVKEFLNRNKDKIKLLINISSAALIKSTYSQMKNITKKLGINLSEDEFHTKGSFKGINKNRPNEDDIKNLTEFIKNLSLNK